MALDQLPLTSASTISSDTILKIKMRAMAQALLQRSRALGEQAKSTTEKAAQFVPERDSLLTNEKRILLAQLERQLVKDYLRIMMMTPSEQERPRFDPGRNNYDDYEPPADEPSYDYPPSQRMALPLPTTPPPDVLLSQDIVDMKSK